MPAVLAESGRLTDEFTGLPGAASVEAAQRRHNRPLSVAVTGRPGSGRDTLARAVRRHLGVTAIGAGEPAAAEVADLRLYSLAGGLHDDDLAAVSTADPARTVVVLGKTDQCAEPEAVAAAAAAALGRPVAAVSGLLAAADLRDDDLAVLQDLVAAGITELPSMIARFVAAAEVPDPDERRIRTGLLRRLDRLGLQLCLDLVVQQHPAATSADELNRFLHRCSGIDGIDEPLRRCLPAVRRHRAAELRAALERIAAAGTGRDTAELLLRR